MMQQALVLARLGQTSQALAAREQAMMLSSGDHFAFAQISAAMGRTDEALESLELAIKNGFRNYIWMKVHPDMHNLNGHKRFQSMLARVLK
jgi:tetratricopeptide (TPR) repeat protein